jgi:protein transport protein SEC20
LELSAEIHESLKGLEEELELLRLEAEDFVNGGATASGRDTARRRDSTRDGNRESERSRVAVLLARLTEDLKL